MGRVFCLGDEERQDDRRLPGTSRPGGFDSNEANPEETRSTLRSVNENMMGQTQQILEKALAGKRLTPDEGLALFQAPLHALGRAADAISRRLHPEPFRTFNIDRNINYTNICAAVCDFCAFYRKSG